MEEFPPYAEIKVEEHGASAMARTLGRLIKKYPKFESVEVLGSDKEKDVVYLGLKEE